jgi:hypothetical protein
LVKNGTYRSARWDELTHVARCRECGAGFHLPYGVLLLRPKKAPKPLIEESALDERPVCPFCGGEQIIRRGVLKGGSVRFGCIPCKRRFVNAAFPRSGVVDRRKLTHFEEADPVEEAKVLFEWATKHMGPMAPTQIKKVRAEIMVTKQDHESLELLIQAGVLERAEVDKAIAFRVKVLTEFDRLLEET